METMLNVTVNGTIHQYPYGTTYRAIAAEFQENYPHQILLVNRDGKLRELQKTVKRDCSLSMVTAADKPGRQTYERSAILLMLKAFYDVVGREQVEHVRVEFSLSNALFCRARGSFTLDNTLLHRIEDRMRELVRQVLPIEKQSVDIEDAAAFLTENGMEDKARLLKYRISSRVNLYTLDGFTDYFYGYMVPDTGYLQWFALELFEDGFILRLPSLEEPEQVGKFTPSMKVFQAMHDAEDRSAAMYISNVGEMDNMIAEGNATQLILAHEALMEKRVGDIAEEIARRKDVRFVMIAGPSSSGKTTFSHRLSTQLMACGLRPHPIATDNYFRNREDTPRDANGQYDFEGLGAMDVEQFNSDMSRLLKGETVDMPTFNFKKGVREYNGEKLTLGDGDVLVIEGIHCLNDEFSHSLPKESKYKIYISCLTTLNIDDHNRIPTTDARLLRRIERDARTRGYGAQATIKMWPSVRRGEEQNIFPYQDSADTVFNSSLIYETALLKPYVQPLLFGVPRGSDEYLEAKRLLKFLDYFLPVPADDVPQTSLMREFTRRDLHLQTISSDLSDPRRTHSVSAGFFCWKPGNFLNCLLTMEMRRRIIPLTYLIGCIYSLRKEDFHEPYDTRLPMLSGMIRFPFLNKSFYNIKRRSSYVSYLYRRRSVDRPYPLAGADPSETGIWSEGQNRGQAGIFQSRRQRERPHCQGHDR